MSLNTLTAKKFLLTAGLLIVLGQGLLQLPEFQNYLFPVENSELILRKARKECLLIRGDLRMLNERVGYLTWFQTHNGPDQEISAARLRSFPFFECIRPLAPGYFWQSNIRLAHQTRVKVERKLLYLDTLLKSKDEDFRVGPSHDCPVTPANTAALPESIKHIKQFQGQFMHYQAELLKLTQQLNWLEKNGYKN